jgi:hypothetical protein
MSEEDILIRFKVFGDDKVLEARAEPGNRFIDLFKGLGLYPDDYIITHGGVPVPIDSIPEDNDYTIYKVPSGG